VSVVPESHPACITIDEVAARLNDSTLVIVDVRPLAAYNGWRVNGEPRGGHIPGAISFPGDWLRSFDEVELRRALQASGITGGGRDLVLYGYDVEMAAALATKLNTLGERDVRLVDGDWHAWSARMELPVEQLPNFQQLVNVDWLRDLIAGRDVQAAPQGRWLLFHVNAGVWEEYAEAHIPNALCLDTHWLESAHDWNRRSPAELNLAMRRLGITQDTTVILYGRDTETDMQGRAFDRRAGQIAAARAAMILHCTGVDDVRLLDGGYGAWAQAGNPLEARVHEPIPVESFGATIPARPAVFVDLPEARQMLADRDGAALASVRCWEEHIGKVSGYDYIGPAGRIKGDVWVDCGTDAHHMQHYRNVDNTMRSYPEIVARWAEAGITADKRVAFYCGTGWRASETWFYAWLMGWPRIAVYDGGWLEWSADPVNNPIEKGAPATARTRTRGHAHDLVRTRVEDEVQRWVHCSTQHEIRMPAQAEHRCVNC
jgi:thiosulfate/3-mercaptopyruvate sulfurtransferase